MESETKEGGTEHQHHHEHHKSEGEGGLHEAQAVHHHTETKEHQGRKGTDLNLSKIAARFLQKKYLASILLYTVISLLMFAPIVANITSAVPGGGGDAYLNLWGLWWVSHAIFVLHTSIWSSGLLFYPIGSNLVYQTMSPIGSLLVSAFEAVSVPFAYNLLFFFGFVLSGITMFILADYLTESAYAAFFAGLVFTFSSMHIALGVDHIDWIAIGWVPLALYFFLRLLREDENKYFNAAGLGITFVLIAFMGDLEQAVMASMLFILILLLYALYTGTRRMVFNKRLVYALALAVVIAFALGSWGFIPVIHTITSGGLGNANYLNDIEHNELWSYDLLSFFLPSYYNGFFNSIATSSYYQIFAADSSERAAYIGYTVIILAVVALLKDFKKARLWLVIALVFGWLALGPYLQVDGQVTPLPGLYYAYHLLPGINVIREPDRFGLIFILAVAVLAAFGMKIVLDKVGKIDGTKLLSGGLLAVVIISILFLIESNGYPLTQSLRSQEITPASIPQFYTELANLSGNFSVLQLPILDNPASPEPGLYPGEATYFETANGHPIVGGDITRTNDSEELSLYNMPLIVEAQNLQTYGVFGYASPVSENYTAQTLLTLSAYSTAFVSVQKSAYSTAELNTFVSYLASVFGNPEYNDNSTIAFSTQAALENSLYRSFVSYPFVPDWEQINSSTPSGGRAWSPVYPGVIDVYAPYANANDISQEVASGSAYTINTLVSFQGASLGGDSVLDVDLLTQTGLSPVGTFELTGKMTAYTFNTLLLSGPEGNGLAFLITNSTGTFSQPIVELSNITFTRGSR